MTDSRERLQTLVARLERIWRIYLEAGPGRVDEELFEEVETLGDALTESVAADDLREAIRTGVELGRRCVYRSEGLCFITGEAGLVPRRDLHEKFEGALATMRAALEEG